METLESSLMRAEALQLRIADCELLLRYALDFANRRFTTSPETYMDLLESTSTDRHVVNTSTALIVTARNTQLFDKSKLNSFDNLNLANICKFYTDAHTGHWNSKETQVWSPYVTALAVGALTHIIALSADEHIKDVSTSQTPLLNILHTEARKLVEFSDNWSKQKLVGPEGDYDHPFFAYNVLESLEQFSTVARARLFQVWQGSHPSLYEACKAAVEAWTEVKKRILGRLHLEFCRQMTYQLAGIHHHVDVSALALSLYCIGRHDDTQEYVADDVMDAGLDVVFSLQQQTGFWDTSTPLLGSATGLVGCSTVEIANCLLRLPRARARFDDFFANFNRLLIQLERGFEPRKPERGWPVDIRRKGTSRQTWYGFFAFEFVSLFLREMRLHVGTLLLKDFRYERGKPTITWAALADYEGYKDKIDRFVLLPRKEGAVPTDARFSIILFGPPGTGKTSFARAVAYELGWGLIEVGPGDFLSAGPHGIFAHGDEIFKRLLLLRDVVVLFDEIDELVIERTSEADKLSRFLTTYMLPWIQRLRDRESVVFIFATNHIDSFDSAIKRPGRFDLVIPIGPPQGEERLKTLKGVRMKLGFAEENALTVLANKAPERATIGDFIRAAAKIPSGIGDDERAVQMLAQINDDTLLIDEKQWGKFVEASRRYT